jgi:protein involved in polysaccharide export with SLBB domain
MKTKYGRRILLASLLSALCVCSIAGQARQQSAQAARSVERSESRAQQEADRLVSLAPEKIIVILSQEPGLLLQVKKLVVREAYNQGRILEANDLEDEEIFRLVREDWKIRALVTREIEDRRYVQAKPSQREREELENRGYPEMQRNPQMAGFPGAGGATGNQEDAYWRRRDQPTPGPSSPFGIPPSSTVPNSPPPVNPPGGDAGRQLNRAQAQSPAVDYVDVMPQNPGGASDSSQMASLLNASSPATPVPGVGGSARPDAGVGSLLAPPMGVGRGPIFDVPTSSTAESHPEEKHVDSSYSQRASIESAPSFDRPFIRRKPNPYADVPSLYDLYSQYSDRPPTVERFGQKIFRTGTGNSEELPMDLPVGPDYVVGPGDGLSIDLWGSVSQRLQRVVDRQGRVALPEVGTIEVSGRSLGDVQRLAQRALRTQFRDIYADVSLSRIRTVRVYVVGDVERPGAYDISSLSTPLNAVYTAGGPTARGSLRILRHLRGTQLVQEVDVYDLLLRGIRAQVERLQPGDTVLVPPVGPEVTLEGMVRRPAIYELHGEKSLAEVLELAGGVLPTGTLREIDVDRLQAHDHRSMLRVDLPDTNNDQSATATLDNFQIQDGDKVRISPILPYSEKTIYLDGHVFRPGKYAFREGMKVTDVIKSYSDLLPEPSQQHAEIIRLNPPDYTPRVIAFNLGSALSGEGQDIDLKPFDTIRVFGRYDFENPPLITVSGEVRDPGDHLTNGVARLSDAIYLAGGMTPDAEVSDAQVFRKTKDGKLKVISVDLAKALSGDSSSNIPLEGEDRVFIHKSVGRSDPPTVSIQGEVSRPGKYPLGEGMTAAELVRVAGGMNRSAYTEAADLTRYEVAGGKAVTTEHVTLPIARAMEGDPDTDYRLRDGDVLTIRQLAGWSNVGATITVKGEVQHPGTFGIQDGERLSSIIARAGGFSADAYPYGAVFTRIQVRDLEEKNQAELIGRLRNEGATLKMAPEADLDSKMAKEASLLQWKSTLEKLQTTPPVGRLVVHISSNTKRWTNTASDIQVRAGDTIYIPKRPNFVTVDGTVYNPTAITYKPGKRAAWYLQQAGGPTSSANKKAVFVIRADGSVVGGAGGMFNGGALDAALQPGDMVIVPEKAYGGPTNWRNTLQVAQLVSAVGIAVQVARGF